MRLLRVALLPTSIRPDPKGVCAIVDVIRASTTLTTIATIPHSRTFIASNIQTARAAAEAIGPQAILAGERGGIAPDGFSYGNSPLEFAPKDLTDRTIVLSTTIGPWLWHKPNIFPVMLLLRACQPHPRGRVPQCRSLAKCRRRRRSAT